MQLGEGVHQTRGLKQSIPSSMVFSVLERIHLENFKASRDVDVRLAPLTVLAGLNSTGKSTLLQAVGLLRQSYDTNGNTNGLSLSGPLVHLGQYRDVLSEGAVGDAVAITIEEGGTSNRWTFRGVSEANQLELDAAPTNPPLFVKSPYFQFLQADRIGPRTLYPQASQQDRNLGFLGVHGEYTVDFLSRSSSHLVAKARAFPRTGLGIDADLLDRVAPTDGLLDQVSGWLQQLSPGARLFPDALDRTDEVLLQFSYLGKHRESKSNPYRPTNVGFGLTYSLPIIVSCLASPKGSLVLMENPEAHLHPQGQASLGELIARSVSDGVQIIVETHSDHLLNGLRLAVKNKHIKNDMIALHFFSRATETGEVIVQSPAILENGRVSNWPDGFFDQWDKDIEALLD
jgi:predicted ATPase